MSVASLIVAPGLIVLAYFVRDAWPAVMIISAGSFAASLAGPCAYSITIDMGGKHTAAVFSTMNMLGNIGAIACAPFVSARIDPRHPALVVRKCDGRGDVDRRMTASPSGGPSAA
jgi:hypothetical protein